MNCIDAQTLALAFDAHAAQLALYARQWASAQNAEDVVQEAFIRLAAQPETPRNIKAWLFSTVRNAALDALKMERRRLLRDHRAGLQRQPLFAPDASASITAEEIQHALAALPPEVRE